MVNKELYIRKGMPENRIARFDQEISRTLTPNGRGAAIVEEHPQIAELNFGELLPVYADYLLSIKVDTQSVESEALRMLLDYSRGDELQRKLILDGLNSVYKLHIEKSPKRLNIDNPNRLNNSQQMIEGEALSLAGD